MPYPSKPTDTELVESCRNGEVSAFGAIVEKYQNVVCAVAFAACGNRALSEDVAQDAFVAAWTDLHRLEDPKKLRGWLCSIARNKARDALRRRHREVLDDDPAGNETASEPSPLEDAVAREDEETIWAALESVPESCREPLVLFYREDKSIKQVASGLGITIDAAKKRLERGRQALKSSLQQLEVALADGRPSKAFTVGVIAVVAARAGVASAAAASSATATATASKASVGWKLAGLAAAGLAIVVGALWWQSRTPAAEDDESSAVSEPVTKRVPTRFLGPRRGLDITEPKGSFRLHGVVVDMFDQPVSGAIVSLSTHPTRTQTTDGAGTFSFDGLVGRTYGLEARTAAGTSRPTGVHVGPETEPVVLRIEAGSSAELTMIDAVTREPVSGVEVELRTRLSSVDYVSGEDGVVRIDGLNSAFAFVVIRADGYGPLELDLTASGEPGVTRRLVALERGPPVAGKVVDESGVGIAGARVTAMTLRGDLRGAQLQTDSDGEWKLDAMAPGQYAVSVLHPDYVATHRTIIVPAGSSEPIFVESVMPVGHSATGVVLRDGKPVASAWVTAEFDDGPKTVLTDERGRFAIKGLPVTMTTLAARHGSLSSQTIPLDVSADPVDIELRLGDHAIRGRVVDAAGKPVAGASVMALIAEPDADSDVFPQLPEVFDFTGTGGEFVLAPLEPGQDYQLTAVADGVPEIYLHMIRRKPTIARAGTGDVRLQVTAPSGVTGRVRGADGRVPSEFAVNLQLAGVEYSIPATTPFAETDGEFALHRVPPARYVVTVTAEGYAPARLESVAVEPGGPTVLGDVVLPVGAAIHGTVVDDGGNPVAGARVFVGARVTGSGMSIHYDTSARGDDPLSVLGEVGHTAVSGPDGSFSFRGLHSARGMLSLVAEHPDGRRSPVEILDVADHITPTVRLHRPGSLTGTVAGAAQSRIPIDVVATPRFEGRKLERMPAYFSTTVIDGAFRLDRLAPGSYLVFSVRADVHMPPAIADMTPIEITAGGEQTLDLTIAEPAPRER